MRMPIGETTRPDVYGIPSRECCCLCAARPPVATVVQRARGSRVENVSTRGRPTRHQRQSRAPERLRLAVGLRPTARRLGHNPARGAEPPGTPTHPVPAPLARFRRQLVTALIASPGPPRTRYWPPARFRWQLVAVGSSGLSTTQAPGTTHTPGAA